MSDVNYVNGLYVYAPSERAPDWVKANVQIDRKQMIEWLNSQPDDKIRVTLSPQKDASKWKATVDKPRVDGGQYTPQSTSQPVAASGSNEDFDDDLPF
jgi:hypothetical protein|tara:strand:- start:1689 stop:1982 length:294 start_codon:yes stop_codon:yes gene_type:complete